MIALAPTLTAFDRKVLATLNSLPEGCPSWGPPKGARVGWRTAWQVAEAVRADDVQEIRRVLRGLAHFGYAIERDFGHRQRWLRSRTGDGALS